MLFNSTLFLQFFAAFLLLYYIVRNNLSARNFLILAASYVFYGAWDYRFLGLLIFSSGFDFYIGRALHQLADPKKRKTLLILSVVCNLAILGFFKYFDFFASSMADLMDVFGIHFERHTMGILLPVGISFYTFQSMSYAIDVYRRQIEPARNLVHFLAYVAFFPQLVAGPIERASHLLPQFARTLSITSAMLQEGVWLGLWGMFKKVVIADNLAPLAELSFSSPAGAAVTILGTIAFGLQIYCDFSGYSDIARGTARILGFELMTNFNLPYAASNLREFWQRWHISLSTWLRDYLYIPLGGNRLGPSRTYVNLFVTMLVGGLWHGAKWTFVLWGAWHGLGLIVQRVRNPQAQRKWPALSWLGTMLFVFFGWMLFRAESGRAAMLLVLDLARWTVPVWFNSFCISLLVLAVPVVAVELWEFRKRDLLAPLKLPPWKLAALEGSLAFAIMVFWEHGKAPFIYFQF